MRQPTQWRTKRLAWLIDLRVPSDFDERLNWLEGVYRYDINDLCAAVAA
jgi:glutamyl-tRNA reductase